MERKQLVNLHNYLYVTYKNKMNISFVDVAEDDFGAQINNRVVKLPNCIKTNPTEWSLFAFLHEIGHVLTNKSDMKRCQQEFLATQWAIKEAKRIGFDVPPSYIKTYQDYIWKWRDKGIKCGAKQIPTCDELTLTV